MRRAGGDTRHLYLQVDSASEAGLAIAIALDASNAGAAPYTLPAYEPPDDLTDLWVWPDCPGPGLHYERDQGWEIRSGRAVGVARQGVGQSGDPGPLLFTNAARCLASSPAALWALR